MLLHGVQSTDGVAFHIEGEPVLYSDVLSHMCPIVTTFSIIPGKLMRSPAAEREFSDVVRATSAYHVMSNTVPVRLYLAIDLNNMPHENIGPVLSDACTRMFNNGMGKHGAFIRLPAATLTGLSLMERSIKPLVAYLAEHQEAPRACADSGMFAHNMPLAGLVAAIKSGGAGAIKTGAKLSKTCAYCPTPGDEDADGMCATCIQSTLAEMDCIPEWTRGLSKKQMAAFIAESDAAVRASAIVEAERNELSEVEFQRVLCNVGRFVAQDALPKQGKYQGARIVLPKPKLGLGIEDYSLLFSVLFPRIEAEVEDTDSDDDDDDEFVAGGSGESDDQSDDGSDDESDDESDERARSAKRPRTSAGAVAASAAREKICAEKRAKELAQLAHMRLRFELTSM
jgi:hypothetical protein